MDGNGIDYEKAFNLLMCAMIIKTLTPSTETYGGSPDLCIRCMQQGRNFAYGDDGDKKLVCDRCPYNIETISKEDNNGSNRERPD